MNSSKFKKYSYIISFFIHLVILLIFAVVNLRTELEEEEFVTISFGTISKQGSTGQQKNPPKVKQEEKKVETVKPKEEEVKLPEVKNLDENNVKPEKKEEKKEVKKEEKKTVDDENLESDELNEELGQYGIEFDWGGKAVRKIYSWDIPAYPAGVSKEIDVRLRFTILPDGTVGRIIPLRKADTKLESAAIQSLRKWRFEPLQSNKKQINQTAVITFPFRLN